MIVAEQEIGHGIAGPAVPGCVGTAAAVRSNRVVVKAELTEEVVGKISLLHPAAIVEAHRNGVPAMSHRKRISKFPGRYVTGRNVIALTAEGRSVYALKANPRVHSRITGQVL